MIVHIVCFKYKGDVDTPSRTQHRERLKALHDIDGIIDLKVGENLHDFHLKSRPRGVMSNE